MNELEKTFKKDVNKIACLILGLLAIQFGVVWAFYYLDKAVPGIYAVGLLIETVASNGLMILLGKKWLHVEWKEHYLQKNFTWKDILKYVSLLISCGVLVSLILSFVQWKYQFEVSQSNIYFTSDHLYNLYLFISAVLVAQILEEGLNRWIILRTLQKYNKDFAILLSAFLFSLMHMNVAQSVPNFFTGMILAIISLKYDSLLITICIHMIYNGISMVLMATMGYWIFYPLSLLYLALIIYGVVQLYLICIHHKFKKINTSFFLKACIQPVVLILFVVYFFLAIF